MSYASQFIERIKGVVRSELDPRGVGKYRMSIARKGSSTGSSLVDYRLSLSWRKTKSQEGWDYAGLRFDQDVNLMVPEHEDKSGAFFNAAVKDVKECIEPINDLIDKVSDETERKQ